MLIYFARHGQTEHNAQGIIQGNLNVHLNEQGRTEARMLADALKDVPFTEARSSHLTRAFEIPYAAHIADEQTAEIVVAKHPGLKLIADQGLRERQLGSLEGKRWEPKHGIPADAEQSADFRARVRQWAQDFLASHIAEGQKGGDPSPAAADREPTILCVSHGAYLSALLGVLLSPPFSFAASPAVDAKKPCLNTSVMRVRARYNPESERWVGEILSWAEVGHMQGLEQKIGVSDDIRAAFRKALAQA